MNATPNTEHLTTFVNVVRAKSFSAAGRKQQVSVSSIMRQINTLEESLGTRLFVRSTRALRLTEAGEILLGRATRILNEIADARAEIASLNDTPQGVLRISCLPTFGKHLVIPMLPGLFSRYPKLKIQLNLTERLTNPSTERLDAAIRIGEQQDSGLIAIKLATQRRLICASPAYIAQFGKPASLQDLARHRLLDKYDCAGGDVIGWSRVFDIPRQRLDADAEVILRCDDFDALRLSAIHGLGVALLPTWLVNQDIAGGTLVPLLNDPRDETAGIYLLHPLPTLSTKLRAFRDALVRELDAHKTLQLQTDTDSPRRAKRAAAMATLKVSGPSS